MYNLTPLNFPLTIPLISKREIPSSGAQKYHKSTFLRSHERIFRGKRGLVKGKFAELKKIS